MTVVDRVRNGYIGGTAHVQILLETKPESPDWDSLDIHRGDLWMDCQGYMRSVRRV